MSNERGCLHYLGGGAVAGIGCGLGCLGLVIVAVLFLVGMSANNYNNGPSVSSEQTVVQEDPNDSEKAQQRMPVGSVGQVWSAGTSWVLLSRTKDAHEELDKAIEARDPDGLAELVTQGKAFKVDCGTKAKVIEVDWFHGISRVRILGGRHSGKSGWLYSQLVIP